MQIHPSRSSPQKPLTYPKHSPHRASGAFAIGSARDPSRRAGRGLNGCTTTANGRPARSFCDAFSGTRRVVRRTHASWEGAGGPAPEASPAIAAAVPARIWSEGREWCATNIT